MKISVFGLGYVGAVSLACLARDGHQVIGVDVDAAKLDLIAAGKAPVTGDGITELMHRVVASGRVRVTADAEAAVHGSEISFVCVGTPSSENGDQDQRAVIRVAEQIGCALSRKEAGHLVVLRSTVLPGTTEAVLRPTIERASGKRDGEGFALCVQPEFMREGSSLRDYYQPPFTIVGADHPAAIQPLRELFGHLPCPFIATSVRTAEMIKYSCNSFHALKVAFANETARLCHALGIDPFEVMNLLTRDTQLNLSRAYLTPGFAFGGSCLPKDLRATSHLARRHQVSVPLLDAILASNETQLALALEKILSAGKQRVGLLGLSFKRGTDDLRESPLVLLAERLLAHGLTLTIYDPDVRLANVLEANRRYVDEHLPPINELMRPDAAAVIAESELIVVSLADPATLGVLERDTNARQLVIELVALPNRDRIAARVEGLCW